MIPGCEENGIAIAALEDSYLSLIFLSGITIASSPGPGAFSARHEHFKSPPRVNAFAGAKKNGCGTSRSPPGMDRKDG
jgi:hypothetical protein